SKSELQSLALNGEIKQNTIIISKNEASLVPGLTFSDLITDTPANSQNKSWLYYFFYPFVLFYYLFISRYNRKGQKRNIFNRSIRLAAAVIVFAVLCKTLSFVWIKVNRLYEPPVGQTQIFDNDKYTLKITRLPDPPYCDFVDFAVSDDFTRYGYSCYKYSFIKNLLYLPMKYAIVVDDKTVHQCELPIHLTILGRPGEIRTFLCFSPDNKHYKFHTNELYIDGSGVYQASFTILDAVFLPNNQFLYHIIINNTQYLMVDNSIYPFSGGDIFVNDTCSKIVVDPDYTVYHPEDAAPINCETIMQFQEGIGKTFITTDKLAWQCSKNTVSLFKGKIDDKMIEDSDLFFENCNEIYNFKKYRQLYANKDIARLCFAQNQKYKQNKNDLHHYQAEPDTTDRLDVVHKESLIFFEKWILTTENGSIWFSDIFTPCVENQKDPDHTVNFGLRYGCLYRIDMQRKSSKN
ncbi:MAG: hypothetical protein Q4F84_11245, partial [Fibrobacter sp.]|nr:hypothetical protein [Fibrobacter sp.]